MTEKTITLRLHEDITDGERDRQLLAELRRATGDECGSFPQLVDLRDYVDTMNQAMRIVHATYEY